MPRLLGRGWGDAQGGHLQRVEQGINDPDGMIGTEVFIKTIREQRTLWARFTLDVPHKKIPASMDAGTLTDLRAFLHTLVVQVFFASDLPWIMKYWFN